MKINLETNFFSEMKEGKLKIIIKMSQFVVGGQESKERGTKFHFLLLFSDIVPYKIAKQIPQSFRVYSVFIIEHSILFRMISLIQSIETLASKLN